MVPAILVFLVGFSLGIVLRQRERRVQVAGAAVGLVVLLLPFYIHDHGGFNRYTTYEAARYDRPPKNAPNRDRCEAIRNQFGGVVERKCPNYPWPISGP